MLLRVAIVVLCAATLVSACGRRGTLEAPGEADNIARPAPLPEPGSSPGADTLSPGATEPAQAAPATGPQRRFFLDPLI